MWRMELTPLEERWEAVEECQRHFQTAEARASSANVGISRSPGLDLIRIGPALRDEVANWRYGPRFDHRRRRAWLITAATGAVALATVGGVTALGMLSSVVAMALWGTAFVTLYIVALVTPLRRRIGPGRDVTFVTPAGAVIRVPYAALHRITLTRRERRRRAPTIGVRLPPDAGDVELHGNEALVALSAVLPRMNWRGAPLSSIRQATELLDRAEESAAAPPPGSRQRPASPWGWLALGY